MRKKRKLLFISVSVVFVFLVLSCDQSKNKTGLQELTFNVNVNLLNPEIADSVLGITYNPPLGWNQVDSVSFLKIGNLFQSQNTILKDYNIRNIYRDDSTFSMLIVADLSGISDSSLNRKIQQISSMQRDTTQKLSLKYGEFTYNGFDIKQFLLQNPSFINFKLFFVKRGRQNFLLEYILPLKVYAEKIRIIESSIGSLTKINNL